ncbi:NADH-quinone oxidoreductase subunit L [Isoptericola sp. b441]|uniref:NADH-quinone oxidoreductase subunit L n=1 Tax=Actinotalea lenta TaxID=3064654 RepID=A0ABT9D4Z2_9CELL|nr:MULTISPECIES: NADH-quinone oxidoreductase subunit L [unclassified Isoptericola]MDO8105787.1 NADH-quinone oxidoreductase subunit L [Isoptericola sp. b441]MDO8122492.1 NADH-quinone oxidoreductase subunit L [Isoptericola sp. b490]
MTTATLLPAAAATSAATGALSAVWLLVALPMLGAAVLLLGGKATDRWGHWLGVLASTAAFVVAVIEWVALLGRPAAERVIDVHLFSWIPAGAFSLDAGMRLDPLSMTFVLLVTFVGTLIHVYSVAYMEHDTDRRRFFAYLNLFVTAMLLLVLADSYVLLFVGWEGVGLASYLLIGFWNHETPNAVAAKKAFVANRVGDLGLIVAIALIFATFGATDFATVFGRVGGAGEGVLTAIGLLLLLGATGKSAQFPLQSWLGDAMAGPTPVSALIHAATMVTAGVYLVVRSAPVFDGAPTALLVVAIVGAITLLFGAIVASAKDDIKKSLAGSTMSQIGYMMLGAGLGPIGYAFAIFHLLTHGFFKAGLFLGAGSVMHGMDNTVDMRRFGGLAPLMKITWVTFGLGWLAIMGVPPFSGYWSKDKIIESAFAMNGGTGWQPWVFGLVAMIGAGITAFYMSRMFFMTFHGTKRWSDGHGGGATDAPVRHPHESPALMTWPMIILAVGSAALGGALAFGNLFTTWLEPVTGHTEEHSPVLSVPVITILTLLLVAAGIVLAWRQYWAAPVAVTPPPGSVLTKAARQDLYQDQVNDALLVLPGQVMTRSLVYGDRTVVDGAFTGLAHGVLGSGSIVRRLQNGFVRSYAATMLAGVVVLVAIVLAFRI